VKSIIASGIVGAAILGATYHACVTAQTVAANDIVMRQCEAYLRLLSDVRESSEVAFLYAGTGRERDDKPISRLSYAMANLAGADGVRHRPYCGALDDPRTPPN
jgi:Flp pilus assembly protein TadD